jgi:hypothetical protein
MGAQMGVVHQREGGIKSLGGAKLVLVVIVAATPPRRPRTAQRMVAQEPIWWRRPGPI